MNRLRDVLSVNTQKDYTGKKYIEKVEEIFVNWKIPSLIGSLEIFDQVQYYHFNIVTSFLR